MTSPVQLRRRSRTSRTVPLSRSLAAGVAINIVVVVDSGATRPTTHERHIQAAARLQGHLRISGGNEPPGR